jgi:hypothetical protein
MKKMKTLQEELRAIVLEYTRQTAELLDRSYADCYWVGTDDHNNGTYGVCDMGDCTFLTLEEMQVIIDELPRWVKQYGSRDGVREEVESWLEWSLREENIRNGSPRINLEHWLAGVPRKPWSVKYETAMHEYNQCSERLSLLEDVSDVLGADATLATAIEREIENLKEIDGRLEEMRGESTAASGDALGTGAEGKEGGEV